MRGDASTRPLLRLRSLHPKESSWMAPARSVHNLATGILQGMEVNVAKPVHALRCAIHSAVLDGHSDVIDTAGPRTGET